MRIQCNCGKFQAEVQDFPKANPGRLVCYCDDCQAYLNYLGRSDLMDPAGGTEIIPSYPANVKIVSGAEQVRGTRLSDQGMFRWSTACCNSPIANARPGTPWLGMHRNMYIAKDALALDQAFGPDKTRVLGKFATGPLPAGTPAGFNFKAMRMVLPFILKGILGGKAKNSPFVAADGKSPITAPLVLSPSERAKHTPKR